MSKKTDKKERKRARSLERAMTKKSPNLGLCACTNIFYIFVPNLREIYQFGKKLKIAFSVKQRPIKGHGN